MNRNSKNAGKVQKSKNKNPTAQPKATKRKPRSKFRPTFKQRAVYSFAKFISQLSVYYDIENEEENDTNDAMGFAIATASKFLSNSIEMICKESLSRVSLFLIPQKLNGFDSLGASLDLGDEQTCGAIVALARASKVFQKEVGREDLNHLENVFAIRNRCEHGEFYIQNFDNEIHKLIKASEILISIYNSQFKSADLKRESLNYCFDVDLATYESMLTQTKKDFQKVATKAARLSKTGSKFVFCQSCHFRLAKLDSTAMQYECLWCGDKREKRICQEVTCRAEFWGAHDNAIQECGATHLKMNQLFLHPALAIDENSLNWTSKEQTYLSNQYFPRLTMRQLAGFDEPNTKGEQAVNPKTNDEKKSK